MATWTASIAKIDKPTWSNREASGIILFAREVVRLYGKGEGFQGFDWYPYALTALGWKHPGDKFKVTAAHQALPYGDSAPLRASLKWIATTLDAEGRPFQMVADPRGSDASFRKLAADAWAQMQADGAPPPLPGPVPRGPPPAPHPAPHELFVSALRPPFQIIPSDRTA